MGKFSHALEYAHASLQQDRDIVLAAKGFDNTDRGAVLAAVGNDVHALKHADASLRQDKDFILAAAAKSDNLKQALAYADASLWQDKDFVFAAVQRAPSALAFAPAGLAASIVETEPALWRFLKPNLRQDPRVQTRCTRQGVTLSFLRRFQVSHAATCVGKTTAQVTGAVQAGAISWADPGIIVKETEASQLSYLEAFLQGSDEANVATVFVSHPWAGGFDSLVETCSRFPNDIFWIDIFCKNQWVVNSGDTATELQNCVQMCRDTASLRPHVLFVVHPWPNPIALSRIWCLFELMHALLCNAQIHMSMSPEAQTALVGQTREEQLVAIAEAVRLDNAQASVASDIDMIMADIDRMPGGRVEMERKLKAYLRSCLWVYLHPETTIEPEPEPQPESEPEPEIEPQVDDEVDTRAAEVAAVRQAQLQTHVDWLRGLAERLEVTGCMSEE
eukprot:COSAG05_NODE_2829_length_2593_cov_1.595830_3_plen_446_part_01